MKKQFLFLLFLFSFTTWTQGQLFWTNISHDNSTSSISTSYLDGTNVNNSFITGLATHHPWAITIDATNGKILWLNTSTNSIGRADLDGTNVNNSFITGIGDFTSGWPFGLTIDATNGKIYWVNSGVTNSIGRADLDGTNVNNSFITAGAAPNDFDPSGIAIDETNGKILWTNRSPESMGRADLDGTNVNHFFIPFIGGHPTGITINATNSKIYWCNFSNGTIGRADLDGTNVNISFISGAGSSPRGITIDETNGKIWCNTYSDRIRFDLDGNNPFFIPGINNSSIMSITSFGAAPTCDAALTLPANGSTGVLLGTNITWSAASGSPTGYKLKIGTTSGGSEFLAETDLGAVTTYNPPTDLAHSTTYYVNITPHNSAGIATGCTEYSFTTVVPCDAALISPANGSTDVSTGTDITWSVASGSPIGYRLKIGTTSGGGEFLTETYMEGVTTYNPPIYLAYGTTYYVNITPYYGDGYDETGCTEYSFTTAAAVDYCASSGNTQHQTGVAEVALSNLLNADTDNQNVGYEDFTAMSATVSPGNAYALNVKVNTNGNWNVNAKIWIDWNKDFDFNDPGEEINMGYTHGATAGLTSFSPYSLTIPAAAALGNYRMRVAAAYYAPPIQSSTDYPAGPCENGYDGEVEDYTITVAAPVPLTCDAALSSPANGSTGVLTGTNITWSGASGSPTGYKLKIGTTSGGGEFLAETDLGAVSTYNPPTDLAYVTTYYVNITPYNATGGVYEKQHIHVMIKRQLIGQHLANFHSYALL